MKVIISGSTGFAGSEVLLQCLSHPDITSVCALTRRRLNDSIANHPKLTTIIMKDFLHYSEEVLEQVNRTASLTSPQLPNIRVSRLAFNAQSRNLCTGDIFSLFPSQCSPYLSPKPSNPTNLLNAKPALSSSLSSSLHDLYLLRPSESHLSSLLPTPRDSPPLQPHPSTNTTLPHQLAGASAAIWTLGARLSPDARTIDVAYSQAAAHAFNTRLAPQLPAGTKFRFIHLSGIFSEQDQDAPLWLIPEPRKSRVSGGLLGRCGSN